jgi:hypothetical protein
MPTRNTVRKTELSDTSRLERTGSDAGSKARLLYRREALLRAEAEEDSDEALWRSAPRALAADAMDGGGRREQRSRARTAGARRIATLRCGWIGTWEELGRKLDWIRGLVGHGSDLTPALVPVCPEPSDFCHPKVLYIM